MSPVPSGNMSAHIGVISWTEQKITMNQYKIERSLFMTKRCLSWIVALMLFCGSGAYAAELCEFPDLFPGGTGIHYDFRTDASDVPFPAGPGGYKLYLWLNVYDAAGNPVLDRVKKVVFKNVDNNLKFTLRPESAIVLDSPILQLVDFAVWLGHKSNIIGTWKIKLKTLEEGNFETTFTVDESMLELPKPAPVADLIVSDNPTGGTLDVSFLPPIYPLNGGEYRCRVFDETGSIAFQVRGRNMLYDPVTGRYSFSVPAIFRDAIARMETRFYGQPYPDACNTFGGTPAARAIYNFWMAP